MLNKTSVSDIFFDLDHTLWDFERNSALTFKQLIETYQLEVDLKDFLTVYVPLNFSYWKAYREQKIDKETLRYRRLKDTFDQLKLNISDHLIYTLADAYIQTLPEYNHLFPGATEVLKELQTKYRLHIITNGFRDVQYFKMKNSGIIDFFKTITDSESVGVKKPDPKIFQHAVYDAGSEMKNSLMVGDNFEADICGAQQVGMQAIHFAVHGEEKHDQALMIDDLRKLLQLL
jgi:putative hydrolase of the HAD superfamily